MATLGKLPKLNSDRTSAAAVFALIAASALALCPSAALAQRDMGCSPTVANPCSKPSTIGGGRDGGTGIDYRAIEAQRRAQDEAAQLQRQAEAERVERERRAEEQRKKDADFIRNRDMAARSLKGSIGTSVVPNDGGLKGSSTVDTGLKELRDSDRVARDVQGPHAAWKQLHCSAALSGYAMSALSKPVTGKPAASFQEPDFQEFSYLAGQALNALNGQALGVVCPAAPPFPDQRGRAVDMEQVKSAQRNILTRAVAIAERMKQHAPPPPVSADVSKTAGEGPEEKMRRVQRELNQGNSVKITGKTRQEIEQQERDRKELAKLILANSQLEKGELTSVTVEIPKEDAPRRRKTAAAPQ